jgi:methylthioribulose-1-phosphate dehydratase
MARSLDTLPPRAALVEIARDFHARGWMAGTGGNLSAREDADHFWITASGKPKGRLDDKDFLLARIGDDAIVEVLQAGDRPSAETAIHRAIYRRFTESRACLHAHSVPAVGLSLSQKRAVTAIRLPPVEILKAFDGWKEGVRVELPLFENHTVVAKIARDIEKRIARKTPAISALIIRGHGVTVWGNSIQQAYNRYEALEFILALMWEQRRR